MLLYYTGSKQYHVINSFSIPQLTTQYKILNTPLRCNYYHRPGSVYYVGDIYDYHTADCVRGFVFYDHCLVAACNAKTDVPVVSYVDKQKP